MKTVIIKIEQTCCGYELKIDDWFIKTFKSIDKLLLYLNGRITSDFN